MSPTHESTSRNLVAVPVQDGHISAHFGQSRTFSLFSIDDGPSVTNVGEVLIADGSGCHTIADVLAGEKVQTVLAVGIGAGAVAALGRCGIAAVVGVRGRDPLELVRAFALGQLQLTGKLCEHHHDDKGHHACHGAPAAMGE